MTRYRNPHLSQYGPDRSAITRSSGCTWTAAANGVDASTGGARHPSPDHVHDQVPRHEESNPATPGWSLTDVGRAMDRMGVPFANLTGAGWAGVRKQRALGRSLVLQGDSDQFANSTCSGAFNGDHAIHVHPDTRTLDGPEEWWINDPICPDGRWERESVLRRYAEKFEPLIRFGAFTDPVPEDEPKPVNPKPGERTTNVTIRYVPPETTTGKTMHLVKGQNLYASPAGRVVTVMSHTADVPYLGLASGVTRKWRAVIVPTRAPYDDDQIRPTVLYVPGNAGAITPSED